MFRAKLKLSLEIRKFVQELTNQRSAFPQQKNRAGPYSDFCCAIYCKTLQLGMTHAQLLLRNFVAQQVSCVISLSYLFIVDAIHVVNM